MPLATLIRPCISEQDAARFIARSSAPRSDEWVAVEHRGQTLVVRPVASDADLATSPLLEVELEPAAKAPTAPSGPRVVLPPLAATFASDWLLCGSWEGTDDQEPTVVRSTTRTVVLEVTPAHLEDLIGRARHYAGFEGPERAENRSLVDSAVAVLARLEKGGLA